MEKAALNSKTVTLESLITSQSKTTCTTESVVTGNAIQTANLPIDVSKDEAINSSFASTVSDNLPSLSANPCSSSSPIVSPTGKFIGKNANGTSIIINTPSNEAEVQLYRVLQRASLLVYYDTLLEMGGDDVSQLYEAGEEEFLEIMSLVGMASKPLHVRRLQKVLHEWASNPSFFQEPLVQGSWDTPKILSTLKKKDILPKAKSTGLLAPTLPSMSTACSSKNVPFIFSQSCTNATEVPAISMRTSIGIVTNLPTSNQQYQSLGNTGHQVSSSSLQVTPLLTESQVSLITEGAESIARELPQREPRTQSSKKRATRELEQVIRMNINDPRRMDEIRKYSAIYGRFDCKRRPEKPLTLHEVCVNEAAAQLCRLVPTLLTRRDELFPLARKVVRNVGFGYSANIARIGNFSSNCQLDVQPGLNEIEDYESSQLTAFSKKQRLSSTEADKNIKRQGSIQGSKHNLFGLYNYFLHAPIDPDLEVTIALFKF